jgi:hypothetical protein
MALGSTQPLTEISTRNFPWGKGRSARKADNLTAVCESIVWKMWEPRCLTNLLASTACYRDSCTFFIAYVKSSRCNIVIISTYGPKFDYWEPQQQHPANIGTSTVSRFRFPCACMFCFAFGFVDPSRTKAVCSNWVHPVRATVLPSACHTELDSLYGELFAVTDLFLLQGAFRIGREWKVIKRENQKGTRSVSDNRTVSEGARERFTSCTMPRACTLTHSVHGAMEQPCLSLTCCKPGELP